MKQNHPFKRTELGFRFGDLDILFGTSGKGVPLRSNSLVLNGSRNIVVDPSGAQDRHRELAKDKPILFFTHYHGDHRMAEHCYDADTTVWAGALDAGAIESMENSGEMIGGSAEKMFIQMRKMLKIQEWPDVRHMQDGDTLEMGGCQAKLIHLPGHTPGHAGLFFPELSLLFITDIDLSSFGPWYGNTASDKNQFMESVRRVRDFECDWYYTSHGEVILDREAFLPKINAFDAHFERRDNTILSALEKGVKSIDELCSIEVVYRQSTLKKMEHFKDVEKVHVLKHLKDLVHRKLVCADENYEHFSLA